MRFICPNCSELVVQDRSWSGMYFCRHCRRLFEGIEEKLPPWILGVLVIVTANWQMMCRLYGSA
jgi:ribosomal protein L37AE/L43A